MRLTFIELSLAVGICGLPLLPTRAEAQIVSVKGTATTAFGPRECGTPKGVDKKRQPLPACRTPSAAEWSALLTNAQLNAIERYAATAGEATLSNFTRVQDSVARNLDTFLLGTVELNRDVDTTLRRASLTVRVDLNEAKLAGLLHSSSAVATTDRRNRSLMGMFVMARSQQAIERYDGERRTNARNDRSSRTAGTGDSTSAARRSDESERRADARRSNLAHTLTQADSTRQSADSGDAATRPSWSGQRIGNTAAARDSNDASSESADMRAETNGRRDSLAFTTQRGSSSTTATSTVSGGSTLLRAERIEYGVAQSEDLNSILSGELAKAGFEAVEAAFLEDSLAPGLVDAVRSDFGSGDDLRTATVRRLARAAQNADVSYVIVGTVDIGLPTTDEVSGNQRVYAKVSAKVLDLSGRLPRTVVSVAPAQHAGLGPDATVARLNALRSAADEIGREVVEQLNARAIR